MLLCLIAPYGAKAQEAQYDLLYTSWTDDSTYSIKVVNAVSGEITDVGTLQGRDGDAGWSPNGQFIYLINFTASKTQTLTLINMKDGSHQLITDHFPTDRCVLPLWWSPDDHFLVYWTAKDELNTIHILDTQQNTIDIISDMTDFSPYPASWSPNGRYFAYRSAETTSQNKIAIWDTQKKRVRFELDTQTVVWSPIEDRVAYQSDEGNIAILDINDGSEQHYAASGFDGWSANGRYLKVYTITQDGSRQVRLVDTHSHDKSMMQVLDGRLLLNEATLLWSPDGRYLIYETLDTEADIAVFDLSNGESKSLEKREVMETVRAEWSPSGHWIAFPQKSSDMLENIKSFWVFDIDSQKQQHFDLALSSDFYEVPLRWSPDGKHLMAWTDGVSIFDRADWVLHPVVENGSRVTTPRWSSDGRYLAFVIGRDERSEIHAVDIQNYETKELTDRNDLDETILGWRGSGKNESLIVCGEG